MKIGYVINEKYKEMQILICTDKMDNKVRATGKSISDLFEETLTVSDQNSTRKIAVDSIIRVYGQNQKVYVQTAEQVWQIHVRLYEAEETLGDQFIRISNSEMVNRRKISHLDTTLAGTIKIYLTSDISSYVSRRYVSRIKKALDL